MNTSAPTRTDELLEDTTEVVQHLMTALAALTHALSTVRAARARRTITPNQEQ